MSDIDERTRAREEALKQQLTGARRLARPEEFVYDKAQEAFWDLLDGTVHSEKAVDAAIPIELWRVEVEEGDDGEKKGPGRPKKRKEKLIPPSRDIMRVENDQFVEGSTWWPGKGQIINDLLITEAGHIPAPGRRILNLFRAVPNYDSAIDAGPWIEHVKRLWPTEAEHNYFFDYCAHMVQRPDVKCNAAVVLSGAQRIGKDVALAPVKFAVGSWNTKNIDPDELMSAYRPWLQTLMLVVDEVRPTKDEFHASSMYNILKPMIAAPPDTLPLNDKYVKLRHIVNVLRVFITTNDWMAMYIPPEDQRMFIMHSDLPSFWWVEAGDPEYMARLFEWYEGGGYEAVATWLRARDLSKFNPKGEVIKTRGWQSVAQTWSEPDDALTQAIELLGNPDILFTPELLHPSFDGKDELAALIKSPRKMGFRMQKAGYVAILPPVGARWVFENNGRVVRSRAAYVKVKLSERNDLFALIKARGCEVAARLAGVPHLRTADPI